MTPYDDPRAEWTALVRGLRRTARRREALGLRLDRKAALPAPHPGPESPSPPTPVAAPAPVPTSPEPGKQGASGNASPAPPESPATRTRHAASRCITLAGLADAVSSCTECGLHATRTQTVFADGEGTCRVMFVGEAPGFHEDQQGIPFVGPAGQLLNDIVQKAMGLRRDEAFICNVLKCRPPDNRDPSPEEKRTCTPWLDRQIEMVEPEVIIALGRHAAGHLLGSEDTIGRMRGRIHDRNGRRVVATYHPAYLLRSPGMKKECWKDIQLAMGLLGLTQPPRPSR